jgi:recombination protein RecT
MSNTALTKRETVTVNVSQYLNNDKVKKYLEDLLKDRTGQFVTTLVSLSKLTPGLDKCDPKTLLYCGLKAASLNLPLDNNLGFAYVIPYNNRKESVVEAQFQAGYRAFVQLAQRTGQYRRINVIDVRAGELKKWDPFTEELSIELIEDQEKREKTAVIGYAGMFELVNGYRKVTYWTKEKVLKHARRFSKTFNNGPWQTDQDAMCKKTVLKDLLSKWGPMSTELVEAIKYDGAVIRKDEESGAENPDYVDFRQAQEQNGALFGGTENTQVNP